MEAHCVMEEEEDLLTQHETRVKALALWMALEIPPCALPTVRVS